MTKITQHAEGSATGGAETPVISGPKVSKMTKILQHAEGSATGGAETPVDFWKEDSAEGQNYSRCMNHCGIFQKNIKHNIKKISIKFQYADPRCRFSFIFENPKM